MADDKVICDFEEPELELELEEIDLLMLSPCLKCSVPTEELEGKGIECWEDKICKWGFVNCENDKEVGHNDGKKGGKMLAILEVDNAPVVVCKLPLLVQSSLSFESVLRTEANWELLELLSELPITKVFDELLFDEGFWANNEWCWFFVLVLGLETLYKPEDLNKVNFSWYAIIIINFILKLKFNKTNFYFWVFSKAHCLDL